MPQIIVNADDFGMTAGVNRAVVELHAAGVLTSATLMANAAAAHEAIEIAKTTPSLGVGCHVVLVDGTPVARDVPSLAPGGKFHSELGSFLPALLSGRIREEEIEREATQQIGRLLDRGLHPTHVDTHKHTHMFPRVLRPVLRAAKACGIRAVRNPFEPRWSIAATPRAPFVRYAQVRLLRTLENKFRRIVAQEGFVTTAGALGVLATGTLNQAAVSSLLAGIPPGHETYELVTHPGYNDAALEAADTRLRHSRDVEREALKVLKAAPLPLVSFADL